jgi:hypothetical protein
MTGHTRLAFHEWIRLQFCHLVVVTGGAYAQRRRGRDALCCDLAVAHGALDIIAAMRAAFPLGIRHLVAARTGFPGWNRLMVLLNAMSLLSNGRLDGSSQNEKNEQGRTEQKCAESVHGQKSPQKIMQHRSGDCRRAVLSTIT